MSRRAVLALGTGAVITTAAVIGISASGAAATGRTHSSRPSVTTLYTPAVTAATLPLDSYHLSNAQEAQRANLRNVMARACMTSFGLSYLPHYTDRTKITTATFAVYDSRRYGISDPVAASRFGYHMPPEPNTTSSSSDGDQADTSLSTMSADKRLVFAGISASSKPSMSAETVSPGSYHGMAVPAGGCLGQTDRQLLTYSPPGLSSANNLAAQLNQNDFTKTIHDAKALRADAAWQQCMTTKGYGNYADPMTAAAAFNLNGPATKQEIQTAVADVACQQQVNYVPTLTAIETAYENSSIAQNAAALAPLKAETTQQAAALNKALVSYAH